MRIEKKLFRNIDWILIINVIALMGIGLVMIASATQANPDNPESMGYVKRQAQWVVVSIVTMLVVMAIDYNHLPRLSKLIYVINLTLLVLVLTMGSETGGAQRWLVIGPFQIQPSEFAKIFVIITLANVLKDRAGKMNNWYDLIIPLAHVGVPMALVMIQPDLGTSLVFIGILFGMFLMAGVPLRYLGIMYGGGFAVTVAALWAHFNHGLWLPLKDYQIMRLVVFINPEDMDPLGSGYQIIQSKTAIGSGELWGRGLFNGTLNQLNYLPEQHTDFIFSVVGEELGFVGSTIILLLLFSVLWRGVRISVNAKDPFGSLLAAGAVSMLAFHVYTNVAMTIGLAPVTGIPLPFISYGGSALLSDAIAIGILLNVHMRRRKILF